MTEKLLTALLIAGLSATVKAEDSAYICKVSNYVEITEDRAGKIETEVVGLLTNLNIRQVKIKDRIGDVLISDSDHGSTVSPWPIEHGEDAFSANNTGNIVTFSGGVLSVSRHLATYEGEEFKPFIDSYIATCTKL